tara:strand:- start:158 stop:373 length:216 start_codon:yes stop_codon:yes gene_type:complete
LAIELQKLSSLNQKYLVVLRDYPSQKEDGSHFNVILALDCAKEMVKSLIISQIAPIPLQWVTQLGGACDSD